jgi:hypothetical protein
MDDDISAHTPLYGINHIRMCDDIGRLGSLSPCWLRTPSGRSHRHRVYQVLSSSPPSYPAPASTGQYPPVAVAKNT